jgi:3-hydroxyisobutyrate dehydrogenase-like beta-hydroxyacid dehydrogenase
MSIRNSGAAGETTHATEAGPSATPSTIGVVGLGHMGEAFARNLMKGGFRVVAFDRNAARVEALRSAGAEGAASLQDLADCDAFVTSLPDDAALESVALGPAGLIGVMGRGALHVSMSTVSPGLSRRLAAEHARVGQSFVAAPVLGNPDLARDGALFVLAAGAPNAVDKASPLLARFGERVFVVGEDPAAANLLKLAGNVLIATTLTSLGEVLALLRKCGLDERAAFEVLTNSLFDSRVHRVYGGKIVDRRFLPAGMTIPLALKDLRLALAEAEREAVPMASASLVHDRLIAMMARGLEALDWSALGLLAANDAGLGPTLEAAGVGDDCAPRG